MLVIIQLETKDFTELFAQNCPSPSFVMHSMTLETAGYPTFVSSPRRFGAARSIILNKHILKNVRVFEEERQWVYIQIINNLYIYKRKQIKIKVKWHGVDYNFRGGKIDIDKTICLQRYRQSDNGAGGRGLGSILSERKICSLVLRLVWLVGDTYLLHSGIYLYFAFVSRSGAQSIKGRNVSVSVYEQTFRTDLTWICIYTCEIRNLLKRYYDNAQSAYLVRLIRHNP